MVKKNEKIGNLINERGFKTQNEMKPKFCGKYFKELIN